MRYKALALLCTALMLFTSCGEPVELTVLPETSGTTATGVTGGTENTVTDAASSAAPVETSATTEPVTEPTTVPVTEPTTVPVTEQTSTPTAAQTTEPELKPVTEPITEASEPQETAAPLTAHIAAGVYCIEDGKMIYSDNLDGQISLASLTKLLTASVALKYMKPDQMITVGSEITMVKPYSTLSYLYEGCSISLRDLIYAMLLPSGNDAAYTVAVATARAVCSDEYLTTYQAVEKFCELMNSFAAELGMTSSHFANPEGWDDPQHYTTLADLQKLAVYAYSVAEIREAAGTFQKTEYFSGGGYAVWTNTNHMIDPYSVFYEPNAVGLKTGTTANAGCCLIAAFREYGKTYLTFAMGCNSDDDRFALTRQLRDIYILE
ncbi:MAG: D-alanyl-D-alanine carboxypeptidase [Ruminococcus sp.]|nr:D-alanyl-D-alanine carboxypeptidase [Ruminococcus sp.]